MPCPLSTRLALAMLLCLIAAAALATELPPGARIAWLVVSVEEAQ